MPPRGGAPDLTGRVLATLELALAPGADQRQVVPAVKRAQADRFDIGHATVEVLFDPPQACALRTGPAEADQ